jgi:hypothetical protein
VHCGILQTAAAVIHVLDFLDYFDLRGLDTVAIAI